MSHAVAARSADCRIGHYQGQGHFAAGGACPHFAAASCAPLSRRYSPSLSGEAAAYRKGDADNQVGAGLHSQRTAAAISSPAEAADRGRGSNLGSVHSPLAVMSATIGVPVPASSGTARMLRTYPANCAARCGVRRRLPKRID
jgi:hypothetical protein